MKKEFETITGAELLSKPLQEIQFVVDSLIPKGLHILAGAPKVGKSWLALWLSLAVSKGEEVWGNKTAQGTTLYLCFEDNKIRIQNRLFEITDDAPNSVYFCTEQTRLDTDLEEKIRNFVTAHVDTNLIIIDTLQTVRSLHSESSYGNDYAELLVIKNLAYELNIAILLIHHLKKKAESDKFHEISGSTGLQGVADAMGYDYEGNRIKAQQKTVKPPEGYTPKQTEKWLDEQAVLFERAVKNEPQPINKSITFAQYAEIWLRDIAPQKLAKSTLVRDRREIERFLPHLGHHKLKALRGDMFREYYAKLRLVKNQNSGNPLAETTVEGNHAVICSVLTSAMEQGYITHNPAWRTYKPVGKRKEKIIADAEIIQKLIIALESESIKYEVFYKLIIATGMRRGECCGLRWSDLDFRENTIHIQRNVVKIADEEVFTKEPKTTAGDRYVYFSGEMASLLREYQTQCREHLAFYEGRELMADGYLFQKQGSDQPMTPSTFTARFKKILKKSGLPVKLNVHSLRHTNASLMIAGGVDVATAAGLLGHAQPSTTLDIYSHAFDKNKKKAHEQLQKGLGV